MDSGATHTFIAAEAIAWLGLQPVPAEQLEVTLADESVFVCLEKVDVPVLFGAIGTFGECYPWMLTYCVVGWCTRTGFWVCIGCNVRTLLFLGGIS